MAGKNQPWHSFFSAAAAGSLIIPNSTAVEQTGDWTGLFGGGFADGYDAALTVGILILRSDISFHIIEMELHCRESGNQR